MCALEVDAFKGEQGFHVFLYALPNMKAHRIKWAVCANFQDYRCVIQVAFRLEHPLPRQVRPLLGIRITIEHTAHGLPSAPVG